ncbi:TIGR03086 family metal-binding protein [Streptomyces iconiensis]|uniref:TIGR03086 family metal-binding protein n=1 Tax=Streptomyces iconiensis TaxID=1384038 RepID=A0ABT7A927_9ACTN|nr:TIGR03086 family metal-binding protein [Streptomyces iconiensis]MDJ1137857.1 TIGR03086 family metal-binding protein [Streptomyces iconiensis]
MTHDVLRAFDAAFPLFDRTVREVGPDQWARRTGATDWTAKDLVNHLTSEHLWAPHLLRKESLDDVGDRYDGDVTGTDPAGAWAEASKDSQITFHAPHALEGDVHVTSGTIPATEYAWQMTTDLAVHAWDLSQATGARVHLPDSLAQPLFEQARTFVPATGIPGLFDPPVEVPETADWHSRLLALLGRDPTPQH